MESSLDRVDRPWGERTPYGRAEPWPTRVDSCLADGVEPEAVAPWVQSASLLDSGGDAMDIAVLDGRIVGVRGRAAEYLAPHEEPDEECPFQLTTGRTLYHFHTRRTPQLNAAAPEVWVEVSAEDAHRPGLGEGDPVEVSTPRGSLQARLRLSDVRPGVLFVPFHYGYWDTPAGSGPGEKTPPRAANETTITDWDPASKQPLFKTAAAALTALDHGGGTR
jgi:anaerobic selenocysteine-containing dehydrogenase